MFNIITPTYNRAYSLPRVYQSLLKQTCKEFNWLIVDDGSNDNTEEIVKGWIKNTNGFEIDYYRLNENKGKSNAVNVALEYCHDEYVIIADSDDTFISETIAELKHYWNEYKDKSIAAIWTLTKDENGQIIGDKFPEKVWRVNFETRVLKNKIKGEKWHSWRTKVLQSNKMILSNECHIGESHTWNKINRSYDFLCLNIAHRIYHYSEDGLIASKTSKDKHAKAYYNSALLELEQASIKDIISHKYYRFYAFEYIKSSLYLKRRTKRLTIYKKTICFIIFLLTIPTRIIQKIV